MNNKLLRIAKFLSMSVFLLLFLAACSSGGAEQTPRQITVFAASSLSDAMDSLADAFEQAHPGVEVIRHYASSSQLAAQLLEGAQADVFASANEIQMGKVVAEDLTDGDPASFATNRLTIIVPADNPAGIQSPTDLAQPGLSLVLASQDTPIRVYSDQVIAMLGAEHFQEAVYANLVSEESNVRQVAAKIALGEADAGMVYTSDVTPDLAGQLIQIEIPEEYNITAVYPIARISSGQDSELAQAFIEFVLSPDGQAILLEWGFGPALVGTE